ncbi:GNAT family N-acetyltransferase [Amnibacterium flavum]|uniref:GNAT family N-acetyltransferase n=1 Tax=Amnibacterium flavum TaxID=2173173 RepID=A0A2V1HUM5_9MICO|nr:GNAT family N-acetyltransferase [Amnibacterium flavum]PVZ94660.1 GNAT family N-acetyltransferase [Amnibacterium flavum]
MTENPTEEVDAPLRSRLLAAYDSQLRTDAETPSAIAVTLLGPLRLVTFDGGRGFITYPHLGNLGEADLRALVPAALDHFLGDPVVTRVEWKTRGHDRAPGLHHALIANGFVADEVETIMIGDASALAVDVPLPEGVSLRVVTAEADVRAMSAMQDMAFGDPVSKEMADAILRRLERNDGMELWVAEADGVIVSAGRLEPVPSSQFAGIWGGATLEQWRGRGIYRALTSARAHSAIALGKTLIHSDSSPYSRPILERSGLTAVSTTTPYRWSR